MFKKVNDELEYYVFENFNKANIEHGFFNRKNGYSKGCYDSLNFSYSVGDDENLVNKNYEKVIDTFNIEFFAKGEQVHSNNVEVATKSKNIPIYKGTDGFVTCEDIALFTFHADCGSVFMYDIKKDIYGLVHSGWRGTTLNIAREALKKLVRDFGSNPKDILIGIGPSICYDCFEVDFDVAEEFLKLGYEKYIQFVEERKKYHIDIKNILKEQCLEEGVPTKNIEIANLCTMCDEREFYSHRRDGLKRGVHLSFIKKRRG